MDQQCSRKMGVKTPRKKVRLVNVGSMAFADYPSQDFRDGILASSLAALEDQRDTGFAARVLYHVGKPAYDIAIVVSISVADYLAYMLQDQLEIGGRVWFDTP